MLTVLGPRIPGQTCAGVSRRDFLRIGALGLGGLTLADLFRLKAQGAVRSESAHKSVIMVYLPGGPSHIDMYDLKPYAPAEYRGEFKPIRTNVPGIDVCELMPLQARIADKLAIIRNLRALATDTHMPEELLSGFPFGPSGGPASLRPGVRPTFGSVVSRLLPANGTNLPPLRHARHGRHAARLSATAQPGTGLPGPGSPAVRPQHAGRPRQPRSERRHDASGFRRPRYLS